MAILPSNGRVMAEEKVTAPRTCLHCDKHRTLVSITSLQGDCVLYTLHTACVLATQLQHNGITIPSCHFAGYPHYEEHFYVEADAKVIQWANALNEVITREAIFLQPPPPCFCLAPWGWAVRQTSFFHLWRFLHMNSGDSFVYVWQYSLSVLYIMSPVAAQG